MKSVITFLLAGMMAAVAFAGLDPATDSFGVYFDTAGNINCASAEPFLPVTAHLLLMNPAGPTNGFECSVAMTGGPHFVLSATYDVNCGTDAGWGVPPGDYMCGGPASFPVPASGAVVLVTWSIILLAPSELLFHIGPASFPSLPGGLPVVTGDGVLRLCGVASGDVNLPVAGINTGICPVSAEVNPFGAVKSLFR